MTESGSSCLAVTHRGQIQIIVLRVLYLHFLNLRQNLFASF